MERIRVKRGYLFGKELKKLVSQIDDEDKVVIAQGTFEDAIFRGIREIAVNNANKELIIYIR